MVAARVSRQSAEVVAGAGAPASVTRVDLEIGALALEANAVDAAQVSRVSIEVMGKRSATASVTRADVEVGALATGANAVDAALVSRQSVEVFINISPKAAITRADVEVAALATEANAVDEARVSRISAEALARRGAAGPVVPLSLATGSEVFLHDWADQVKLRSAYLTDISQAATGAESRLGLRLKPSRSMDLVWRQTLEEYDADDLSRLDRLYVYLRRITGDRFQVPLFPDMRTLETAHASSTDELLFDTTIGRWNVGARIVVVQLTWTGSYLSHSYHLIDSIFADRLVLTANLGVDVAAYSVVIPVIDCEVALEASSFHETGCLAEVTVTVDEIPGPSQLPPTRSDVPAGTATHLGIPVLDVEPNWVDGIRRGRSRQGEEFTAGRARAVAPQASRSRERHELPFLNERTEFWRLVELFDTRRGRLRSFWHVDQEQIWRVAQLTTTQISIVPLGDFDDFAEELENGLVGLVMADGTFYVRSVTTVQSVASVYRLTITPNLPSLSVGDVARVARARAVRFDTDEMEETWTNAGLAETTLPVIETLEEKDVTL